MYIPVAVYPATREEKLSFKQLRARDLSPIRYKKIAEADEKEVKPEEIVKGFEYREGSLGDPERRGLRESEDRVNAFH